MRPRLALPPRPRPTCALSLILLHLAPESCASSHIPSANAPSSHRSLPRCCAPHACLSELIGAGTDVAVACGCVRVERKGGYGGESLVFAFVGEGEERERRKIYPVQNDTRRQTRIPSPPDEERVYRPHIFTAPYPDTHTLARAITIDKYAAALPSSRPTYIHTTTAASTSTAASRLARAYDAYYSGISRSLLDPIPPSLSSSNLSATAAVFTRTRIRMTPNTNTSAHA
ncbi:hypothetical protein B0H13DRAFT_796499 [Mycena leptocephala]|nr:hypothetical protein B0H13DRAFT_796499 [Mycena leptocephala]